LHSRPGFGDNAGHGFWDQGRFPVRMPKRKWFLVLCGCAVACAAFLSLRCMMSGGSGQDDGSGGKASSGLPPLQDPRIVIEKSAHRLSLYDGNGLIKTYRSAIGGGRADKVKEGDKCTPEGRFYVCVKNPQSKYVLSLGLSYPNEEDAARGLRDGLVNQAQHDAIVKAIREKRQPPWDTPLGGEIMIHGYGAGRDWTLGCIALYDDDIRELYPAVPLGTPVEIRP